MNVSLNGYKTLAEVYSTKVLLLAAWHGGIPAYLRHGYWLIQVDTFVIWCACSAKVVI